MCMEYVMTYCCCLWVTTHYIMYNFQSMYYQLSNLHFTVITMCTWPCLGQFLILWLLPGDHYSSFITTTRLPSNGTCGWSFFQLMKKVGKPRFLASHIFLDLAVNTLWYLCIYRKYLCIHRNNSAVT